MAKENESAINELLNIMAALRAPDGCPWDREQTHKSLRLHAIEEAYELLDAIDAGDDTELLEELGDMLLQVVFHSRLAEERNAFGFDDVVKHLVAKLIRRHPHVFGDSEVKGVEAVWTQWERIKKSEKAGTTNERHSAFDGIPSQLPALLRAEKLVKKARRAGLLEKFRQTGECDPREETPALAANSESGFAQGLFDMVAFAAERGWSAEELLLEELKKREDEWRRIEMAESQNNGV
ncbi:MAG: MazG family protein [Verrucomicrobia bacterium]|nr:MazG family protein [Verrucomicrobiota bacterium]MCF7708263.1 MazG family protein [Verrucomicrobiota bacterium]